MIPGRLVARRHASLAILEEAPALVGEIDAPELMPGVSERADLVLALLLVLLSGGLLFYLAQTLATAG